MKGMLYQKTPNTESRDAAFSADPKSSYTGTASVSNPPIPEKPVQVSGARFYSPGIGRWLSRDPIGEDGGMLLYGFVGNVPVGAVDPLGFWTLNSETGELEFDGHLNIYSEGWSYDDASEGLQLDYREIGSVLTAAEGSDGTVELSTGANVQTEALYKAHCANSRILQDSAGRNSPAIAFLQNDGHMSYSEAKKAEAVLRKRGLVFNRAEHWNVRAILNRSKDLYEVIAKKGLAYMTNRESKPFTLEGDRWELLPGWKSAYHGEGCYKWISSSGRELIIAADGKTVERRDQYLGTFNFGPSKGHALFDMEPYYRWGNTPLDPTPYAQRVYGPEKGRGKSKGAARKKEKFYMFWLPRLGN